MPAKKKNAAAETQSIENITASLKPLATAVSLINIDPDNPREGHDLQGIADSLTKYGQRKPIIVNRNKNNYIEAGTGTFRAATEILHWTHIAAVFVEDDHDSSAGYNLADNRLTDLSYFNPEKMIEMALSVDDDVPGMGTIKEMVTFVDEEPDFDPGEDGDEEFLNSIIFNVSHEIYDRFIAVKERLGMKDDNATFVELLRIAEKQS